MFFWPLVLKSHSTPKTVCSSEWLRAADCQKLREELKHHKINHITKTCLCVQMQQHKPHTEYIPSKQALVPHAVLIVRWSVLFLGCLRFVWLENRAQIVIRSLIYCHEEAERDRRRRSDRRKGFYTVFRRSCEWQTVVKWETLIRNAGALKHVWGWKAGNMRKQKNVRKTYRENDC